MNELGDFSKQAKAYVKARPNYPAEMLDQLVRVVDVHAGDGVIDMAAGTGILTADLVKRGFNVLAVEPNDAMRGMGKRLVKDAAWLKGTFAQSGLNENAAPWMTVGQALHWANLDQALPEFRRVLSDGGCLTAMWNEREQGRDQVVDWTHAAVQRVAKGYKQKYDQKQGYMKEIAGSGLFELVNEHAVRHVVVMNKARYMNLWQSHNHLRVKAGDAGVAALLRELDDYLTVRNITKVSVPYLCKAWTYQAV